MILSPEVQAALEVGFPTLAGIMNIPALKDFFQQIADEGITNPTEFKDRLYASEWYRTHSEAARRWEARLVQDPATAQFELRGAYDSISNMAASAGLSLSAVELNSLADQQMRWELSNAEMKSIIASKVGDPTQISTSGSLAATARSIQTTARKYFLDISEAQALSYATRIYGGTLTLEGVTNQFKIDAAERYPQFSTSILDHNLTVNDATFAMRSHLAALMDTSAEQIDLTNSKYSHLLDIVDSTTGEHRVATTSEVDRWARGTNDYQTSTKGRQEGAKFAQRFMRAMGVMR